MADITFFADDSDYVAYNYIQCSKRMDHWCESHFSETLETHIQKYNNQSQGSKQAYVAYARKAICNGE